LQPELRDDAIDGAFADAEITLAEFLGNDFGTGVRIQEAVTDHLAEEFLSAPIRGAGAPFGAEEGGGAFLQEEGAELKVTLTAKTEMGGGTVNALAATFALDEHGELTGDFIVFGNGQGTGIALDAVLEELEGKHADLLGRVPAHI
jgi:hypothetical protein